MKTKIIRLFCISLLIVISILCTDQRIENDSSREAIITKAPLHMYASTAVPRATAQQIFLRVEEATPAPSAVPSSAPPTAPVSTPEPGSVPASVETASPESEHTPAPTSDGLIIDQFEGYSTDGIIETEDSYRSENVCIQMKSVTDSSTYSDYIAYFVADIHVKNVELLRTAPGGSSFYYKNIDSVKNIGKRHNAIFACSGDYCTMNVGLLIRNGELYRNTNGKYDICVLYRDGTMKTYLRNEFNKKKIIDSDPWQVWSFGPALILEDGTPRKNFGRSSITQRNPRCMIGYYEPGHYGLVLVDGRQSRYSMGLTLKDLAQLAVDLGFKVAYNLDGGKSAVMCWKGKVFNKPQDGGRSVSDIIYIAREG